MAQRKRAGPTTQRSVDRNHPLLHTNKFSTFDPGITNFLNLKSVVGYAFPLLSLSNFNSVRPTDSSVGRAEDCRWLLKTGILRSLVQIRLGGHFQCFKYLNAVSFPTFENPCQKWDSNPRPHSWTRMLLCLQRKRLYS